MCTLTVVPRGEGFRLGCNRDEQRARLAALPPKVHTAGAVRAICPTDPQGGGTWIGVNTIGLAAALLNRVSEGDRGASPAFRCSRGSVVRHALAAVHLDDAVRRVVMLPLRAFDPFTLVLVHAGEIATVVNDGFEYGVNARRLDEAVLFTSSWLGDAAVTGPRQALFDRLVGRSLDPCSAQTQFHAHAWPNRPEISVEMRSTEAATVSRTFVDVNAHRVQMTYEPLGAAAVAVSLPLGTGPCATSQAYSFQPS